MGVKILVAVGRMSVYDQWGLEPVINASGAVTRLGGAPMPAEVVEAFVAAARESVPLDQLQAAASRVIGEVTGAEAGLVTSGAAAGLMLGPRRSWRDTIPAAWSHCPTPTASPTNS